MIEIVLQLAQLALKKKNKLTPKLREINNAKV